MPDAALGQAQDGAVAGLLPGVLRNGGGGMSYTLHLGDCLEYMRGMDAGSVDAVITDPPYLEGDFSYLLPEFLRIAKRVILTPGKIESFNWIARQKPVYEYIWQSNTRSMGGSACMHMMFEPVLAYHFPIMPLGSDLLIYPIGNEPNGHAWPKPTGLLRKLVNHWSKPDGMVFDPFAGSGTTGVACMQLGRNFIGCEISPEYFAIAQRRIADAAARPMLPGLNERMVTREQATQGEIWTLTN